MTGHVLALLVVVVASAMFGGGAAWLVRRFVEPYLWRRVLGRVFGDKPPPLRAEPRDFPGVPNAPIDPEERRALEARALELESDAVDAVERADARRRRKASRRRLPPVQR